MANDLYDDIKEFRVIVTVWNAKKQRMDLIVATNKGYSNGNEHGWTHEIQLEGKTDGLDAACKLLENIYGQLLQMRPRVYNKEFNIPD